MLHWVCGQIYWKYFGSLDQTTEEVGETEQNWEQGTTRKQNIGRERERELLTGRWSEGTSISKVDSHSASASSLLLPLESELLENARTTTTTCRRRRKPPMRGANLHCSPPTAPNICCCMFRDEFLKLVPHFLASHDLVPCSLAKRFFTGCSSITASILASTSWSPRRTANQNPQESCKPSAFFFFQVVDL